MCPLHFMLQNNNWWMLCWLTGCCNYSIFLAVYSILCLFCTISWKRSVWICGNFSVQFSCKCSSSLIDYILFSKQFILMITLHTHVSYLQALCVFILYVRCTAIDPADPGILIGYMPPSKNQLSVTCLLNRSFK